MLWTCPPKGPPLVGDVCGCFCVSFPVLMHVLFSLPGNSLGEPMGVLAGALARVQAPYFGVSAAIFPCRASSGCGLVERMVVKPHVNFDFLSRYKVAHHLEAVITQGWLFALSAYLTIPT